MNKFTIAIMAGVVGMSAATYVARAETAPTTMAPTHTSMSKEVTLKGVVHVTKDAKGEVKSITLTPATGAAEHITLNDEGKKLAALADKTVEVVGSEHAGHVSVKSFTVVDVPAK